MAYNEEKKNVQMYNVQMCTIYRCVQCTDVYNVQMCTMYTCVQFTDVLILFEFSLRREFVQTAWWIRSFV